MENIQNTLAMTIFISYPENHVPHRCYHFASQRENLTWMMQVEELFLPIVKDWLIIMDQRCHLKRSFRIDIPINIK